MCIRDRLRTSGEGVMIAAKIRMTTKAWRRYSRMKRGLRKPILESTKATTGNWKVSPQARVKIEIKPTYDVISNWFLMRGSSLKLARKLMALSLIHI